MSQEKHKPQTDYPRKQAPGSKPEERKDLPGRNTEMDPKEPHRSGQQPPNRDRDDR